MSRTRVFHRKKVMVYMSCILVLNAVLIGRLVFLMIFQSQYYSAQAQMLHERERSIKAARGCIYDRNGNIIATNKTVCTISVIHSQLTDAEEVIRVLSEELQITEEEIRQKVAKVSSREKIKSNVEKEIGDKIRAYDLDGVKVDEDYKRYYPYEEMASKVLGFTGSDNQGIIGLEVSYEEELKGEDGMILTLTDARGVELDTMAESRKEPISGNHLTLSLDMNIQKYAQQAAMKALVAKEANYVTIISMNPQNGEILAMVNVPEFNLNDPYTLNTDAKGLTGSKFQDALNKMWRNQGINDTYEPGSTFKIVTATAGLECGVVSVNDHFNCPGYKMVEDRRIKCHKTIGHGSESFVQATMNSCNPVFIEVGARVGVEHFYQNLRKLGLMEKTGVDVPGEASTIIHKMENVKAVELATMSFGQSFQITPLQLLRAVSSVINGGTLVTPHFGVKSTDEQGNVVKTYQYPIKENVISKETSETMKMILEKVVSEGGGINGYIEGFSIGGKTATSQKLPRNSGKYISSFIGFAPVQNPQIVTICIIDEPTGIYYGGTIAAPIVKELYENILPYLGMEKQKIVKEGEGEKETSEIND